VQFVNPEKVLSQLNIQEGMHIADFGCGHGFFAIPMARMVGDNGIIYAIDILKEALQALNSQIIRLGINNIKLIRANLEEYSSTRIASDLCNIVLITNVLFQSQHKQEIIKEAKRVLKLDGYLAIIDWDASAKMFASNGGWKVTADEIKKIVKAEGFIFEKEFDAGKYHYGLLFKKT